jgi:glutamate-1-semialdehyde 2,1-aminomutase
VIVPWNDPAALREAGERHELAAILAEPVPANMGVVPPEEGFLDLLRECSDQNGALLIFDEVITGFRVGVGGAQERFEVMPDLTIMGKVIGGGLPAAAYGGAPGLMERIAPAGDVYQAGTLSWNPVATAAALATLHELDAESYRRLDRTTRLLAEGLREAAAAAGVPLQVQALTGLVTPFFSTAPVRDYAGARACDLDAYGSWCRGLLDRGVYPPASQFEAWFPSLAHTREDVERTIAAAREAFAELDL